MKEKALYDSFASLDIRVGTIIKVEESKTSKPTWKMTIDFGKDIGTRVSCGAYTNYKAAELTNVQVICVINLGTMKMGPEKSEVLVLGVAAENGGTIPLTTLRNVRNGLEIF
ncbi:protein secretion chaperonin CsaA [Klebsiella variicola]